MLLHFVSSLESEEGKEVPGEFKTFERRCQTQLVVLSMNHNERCQLFNHFKHFYATLLFTAKAFDGLTAELKAQLLALEINRVTELCVELALDVFGSGIQCVQLTLHVGDFLLDAGLALL